ncbi:hypothetical protein PROFUN_13415 [Planoprotostelium fungivorum]|uniref:Uncharacterized protein n=1 Tax=Planoprotostelium fungivorum TaxID=1890364 RepID=A0A2P6N3S3_9EUKA|nr:hypothetical protein PROFUN_13415 [Planoprotostelium fungivorum]
MLTNQWISLCQWSNSLLPVVEHVFVALCLLQDLLSGSANQDRVIVIVPDRSLFTKPRASTTGLGFVSSLLHQLPEILLKPSSKVLGPYLARSFYEDHFATFHRTFNLTLGLSFFELSAESCSINLTLPQLVCIVSLSIPATSKPSIRLYLMATSNETLADQITDAITAANPADKKVLHGAVDQALKDAARSTLREWAAAGDITTKFDEIRAYKSPNAPAGKSTSFYSLYSRRAISRASMGLYGPLTL